MDCRLYCFCDDWVEIESNDYKIDENGDFIQIFDANDTVEDIDKTSMYESNTINVSLIPRLSMLDISYKNITSHRFISAVYSPNKEFDKIALKNYSENNKDGIYNGDIVYCVSSSEFVYDDEMQIVLGTNIVEIVDTLKSKYNISNMHKYRDVKSLVKSLNDYYGFNKFIMFIDGKRVN